MAIYPSKFTGQDRLQPGARGDRFKVDMPGYRDGDDRINRTNMRLNTNEHDSPNIKYVFDERLPVLFRYGYAYGFNQIVIPKGRIVAVDPYRDGVDFDSQKQHNTVTLANGGAPVKVRATADKYKNYSGAAGKMVSTEAQNAGLANVGTEWIPLAGMEKTYTDLSYRPFKGATVDGQTAVAVNGPKAQLTTAGLKIDEETGLVVKTSDSTYVDVIPGNTPIGMLIRNEYTRDDDAFNGMAPGAFNTDCMVELPWFAYKDKAEGNPWGSAYGGLFPGALVKSDENGRVVVSPLSYEEETATMSIAEYELERQQVVGQVYAVNTELVPEGAAKWATWALSDRLNFNEFNPEEWKQNNRRGEDSISHSPYKSAGKYPGYPFDKNYGAHDLHMLASTRGNYEQRMQHEYQYENLGIPGLTDGKNVYTQEYGAYGIGEVRFAKETNEIFDLYFRTPEVDVYDIKIAIGSKDDSKFVPLTEGGKLAVTNGSTVTNDVMEVRYVDNLQGLFSLRLTDVAKAAAVCGADPTVDLQIFVKFSKRGKSGVPTFMDWDGCVGSVKVLLQK